MKEALRLALWALDSVLANHKGAPVLPWIEARDAVKAALEAEDEPVAWNTGIPSLHPKMKEGETIFVEYVELTPPQRTWVGLTDDDKVLIKHDANYNQFMTAGEYADRVQQLTEARLKDKNT
jgi:hypothetical protein